LDVLSLRIRPFWKGDDEIVAMIKELIEARFVRLCKKMEEILDTSFDEETGLVTARLANFVCECPSSSITSKNGVENMLMHSRSNECDCLEDDGEESGEAAEEYKKVDEAAVNKSLTKSDSRMQVFHFRNGG
jgi:Fe-S cluster biogenesis protein NfuA